MNTNKNELWTFFQKAKGIPKDKVKYYLGWIDRFLKFYNGSLDDVSDGDLKAFGDFLEAHGYEQWQVKQAQEAVFLYIEKFLGKKISLQAIIKNIRPSRPYPHGSRQRKHFCTSCGCGITPTVHKRLTRNGFGAFCCTQV